VFLTYLIPDTLLFLPLFKMFAVFSDLTGIQLINRWYVLLIVYPTLTVPFCTWIMIGYFASIPKELDEGRHHRRRVMVSDADAHLYSRGDARDYRRNHFRLHGVMGAISLSAGVHDLDGSAGAARRHHHLLDQG